MPPYEALAKETEHGELVPVICADERSLEHYEAMQREEQYPAVIYEAERWEGE